MLNVISEEAIREENRRLYSLHPNWTPEQIRDKAKAKFDTLVFIDQERQNALQAAAQFCKQSNWNMCADIIQGILKEIEQNRSTPREEIYDKQG
jgi:hypothetical protein